MLQGVFAFARTIGINHEGDLVLTARHRPRWTDSPRSISSGARIDAAQLPRKRVRDKKRFPGKSLWIYQEEAS